MTLKILAFDTSSETCSVSLFDGDECFLEREDTPRKHAQLLLPMISSVLSQSSIELSELDAIAFGAGPGSFTGLRIAVGVAQGLSFGSGIPAIPVSSLQALAFKNFLRTEANYVLSLIDARMDEVYWAVYERPAGFFTENEYDCKALAKDIDLDKEFLPRQVIAEQVSAPEDVLSVADSKSQVILNSSCRVFGSGIGYFDRLPESVQKRHFALGDDTASVREVADAQDVALLGRALYRQNTVVQNAFEIQPTYLRNEVAWKKLPGR